MAGPYRQLYTEFWSDPKVVDSFSPEDKYFYIYLMTNEHTNQCGIYQISLKQIAFDTGYAPETVKSLIDRFQGYLKRIRYNPETREMAILNWAKYNYPEKTADNRFQCIANELRGVNDKSLIFLVLAHAKQEIQTALGYSDTNAGHDDNDTPTEGSSKPLHSPLEAPSKPLGEEEEGEEEQEGGYARAREFQRQEEAADLTGAHFKIANTWYHRFNELTGITTMPDERANLASKKVLEFLGGNLNLAMKAIDFYFENWRDLWFACSKQSRGAPRESRQAEFRFGSFASTDNLTELLSRIKLLPQESKKQTEPWSTAAPAVPDDELASKEQKDKAFEKFRKFKTIHPTEKVS